jgi:hypothetical protein
MTNNNGFNMSSNSSSTSGGATGGNKRRTVIEQLNQGYARNVNGNGAADDGSKQGLIK